MAVTPHLGLTSDLAPGSNLTSAQVNIANIALDKTERPNWISTSVAGAAGDQTLTLAQYDGTILQLTGALTGNRNIILPLEDGRRWIIYNATTGAFTITIKGATGTGVTLSCDPCTTWCWSDGTNFYEMPRNALTGYHAAVLDLGAVVPGILLCHAVNVPAGVTGDVDTVITNKFRVVDVVGVKTNAAGGGTGSVRLWKTGSAITDAMSINVADQTIIRPTTINDANRDIPAGGTLRLARIRTTSTDETSDWSVIGYRVE